MPGAAPPRTAAVATPEAKPSLPAGLYFRNGYVDCDDCPPARWAVIAGILETPREAEGAMATLRERGALDLGFPLALHTDELVLVDRARVGIVVVVAWYADAEDARRRASASGLEVVELLDEEAAFRLQWEASERDPTTPQRYVVQLDAADRVPAFSQEAVDAAEEILSATSWNSYDEFVVVRDQARSTLAPMCELEATRLFVVDDAKADRIHTRPYAWQQVTCDDGRPALVRHTDTRRHAIVLPDPAGAWVDQVVGAECDRAIRERWAWRDDHRVRGDSQTALPGPC